MNSPRLIRAFTLGRQHSFDNMAAVEMYNQRPPDQCPYEKGSEEEKEYDRGWQSAIDKVRGNAK